MVQRGLNRTSINGKGCKGKPSYISDAYLLGYLANRIGLEFNAEFKYIPCDQPCGYNELPVNRFLAA